MNRKLAATFLFITSISMGQNSFNIHKLTEPIKNNPSTLEREKAFNDLKIAGIATVAGVSADLLAKLIKNAWQARQMANKDTGRPYIIGEEISMVPLWISAPLALVEVAVYGYAAYKGYQGAKHLLAPEHKPEIVISQETHIRVKREAA